MSCKIALVSSGDAVLMHNSSPAPLQEMSVSSGDLLQSGSSVFYDSETVTEIQALTKAVEQQTACAETGFISVLIFLGFTAGAVMALGFWIGGKA